MSGMTDISTVWPDWRLLSVMDGGSYGTVYKACHRANESILSAVKIIEVPQDEARTEAMRKEGLSEEAIRACYDRMVRDTGAEIRRMELCKGISSIVSIEDFTSIPHPDGIGATLCIRMELLKTLNSYIGDKQLEEDEVIQLGLDLCRALIICHQNGILHQDIKPENIFVNDRLSSGVLFKLGDFGLARELLQPQASDGARGTLSYLAPEVSGGRPADARSDLYSLGLTLYRLMNDNRLPFLSDKPFYRTEEKKIALQMRLSGMPLPDPSRASAAFARVLKKAAAFAPEDRYQSAREMEQALLALQKKHRRRKKAERLLRNKPAVIAASLLAAAALGLAVYGSGVFTPGGAVPQATEVPMLTVTNLGSAP